MGYNNSTNQRNDSHHQSKHHYQESGPQSVAMQGCNGNSWRVLSPSSIITLLSSLPLYDLLASSSSEEELSKYHDLHFLLRDGTRTKI
ncbi:hypothetical protein Leryth_003695 [Lithospermum erythrorhizon]|nr:hypothetical protein Leryth_003695 [Lithospermum erythrorhizon]